MSQTHGSINFQGMWSPGGQRVPGRWSRLDQAAGAWQAIRTLAKQAAIQRRPWTLTGNKGIKKSRAKDEWRSAEGGAENSDFSSIWLPRPQRCTSNAGTLATWLILAPPTLTAPSSGQQGSGNGRSQPRERMATVVSSERSRWGGRWWDCAESERVRLMVGAHVVLASCKHAAGDWTHLSSLTEGNERTDHQCPSL